jgi:hypothetical protein
VFEQKNKKTSSRQCEVQSTIVWFRKMAGPLLLINRRIRVFKKNTETMKGISPFQNPNDKFSTQTSPAWNKNMSKKSSYAHNFMVHTLLNSILFLSTSTVKGHSCLFMLISFTVGLS